MAKGTVLPLRGAIVVIIVCCLLSDFTCGRPLRPPVNQFDNKGAFSDHPRRISSNYNPYVADKGLRPFGRPPCLFNEKTLPSASKSFLGPPGEIPPKELTPTSVNENLTNSFVLLPSGERVPCALYESCVNCYQNRFPLTVITTYGEIIPASSFTQVQLVTKGRPGDQVRLPNGQVLSANTYCALISGYIDDTIKVQEHVDPGCKNVEGRKVSEPTVLLPTGEVLPYTYYESIVNCNANRIPLRVLTPKGEKIVCGLTELILATQNRPLDAVFLECGAIVTAEVFRDVIKSRFNKDAVLLLPSGATVPLDLDELVPSHKLPIEDSPNNDAVVILPNGEEIPEFVYISIVDSETTKNPKDVIKHSGEVVSVRTLPEILKIAQACPHSVVELENGMVVTPTIYELAVSLSATEVLGNPPEDVSETNADPKPAGEVSVIIYGGLEMPFGVYEAIMDTFLKKKQFSVAVAGKTVPVNSLKGLLAVTHGDPHDIITLPNGMHIKATTFRGVINEHYQNDIYLRLPSGEIVPLGKGKNYLPAPNSPKEADCHSSSKEGSVTVTTGQKVAFHLYELIMCSCISEKPIEVLLPGGSIRIAKTLPELWKLISGHPDYLIKLQDGSLVTADTYGNAVESRYENAEALKKLCGCQGRGLVPLSGYSNGRVVVMLPSKEKIPYTLYESIINSYVERNPLKTTISRSEEVYVYPLMELMLMTRHEPNSPVRLPNGNATTAQVYRDAVIAHTLGGTSLLYPSGHIEPLGPCSRRLAAAKPKKDEGNAPSDECKYVRITVPGRGVQFIAGDGSWDSPRYRRIVCMDGKLRYEPDHPSEGHPCYESVVRPDGKVVYVETRPQRPNPGARKVPIPQPETIPAIQGQGILHTPDVCIDSVQPNPCDENQTLPMEFKTELGPGQVVVMDETGKIKPPSIHYPNTTPTAEPEVLVIDGDGQLHFVDVGDDEVVLYEPPNIVTYEVEPCVDEAESKSYPVDIREEIEPTSDVAVNPEPEPICSPEPICEPKPSCEPGPVLVVDEKGNLHSIGVPGETKPTWEADVKAQHKPGQVIVMGETGIIKNPRMHYPNTTPTAEPEKVLVMDGDGQPHFVDVGDDQVILYEPSNSVTYEEAPCVDETEPIPCPLENLEGIEPTSEVEENLKSKQRCEPEQVVVIDEYGNLHTIDVQDNVQGCPEADVAQTQSGQVVVVDETGKSRVIGVPELPCIYYPENTPTAGPGQVLVIDGDGQLRAVDVRDEQPTTLYEPSYSVTYEEAPCVEAEPKAYPVKISEGSKPIPEVNQVSPEPELEGIPRKVVGSDEKGNMHTINVPDCGQPTPEAGEQAQPEPGQVLVFDGCSKLHTLDTTKSPCEYQTGKEKSGTVVTNTRPAPSISPNTNSPSAVISEQSCEAQNRVYDGERHVPLVTINEPCSVEIPVVFEDGVPALTPSPTTEPSEEVPSIANPGVTRPSCVLFVIDEHANIRPVEVNKNDCVTDTYENGVPIVLITSPEEDIGEEPRSEENPVVCEDSLPVLPPSPADELCDEVSSSSNPGVTRPSNVLYVTDYDASIRPVEVNENDCVTDIYENGVPIVLITNIPTPEVVESQENPSSANESNAEPANKPGEVPPQDQKGVNDSHDTPYTEWPTTSTVEATLEGEQLENKINRISEIEYPKTMEATLEDDDHIGMVVEGNRIPEKSSIPYVMATMDRESEQPKPESSPQQHGEVSTTCTHSETAEPMRTEVEPESPKTETCFPEDSPSSTSDGIPSTNEKSESDGDSHLKRIAVVSPSAPTICSNPSKVPPHFIHSPGGVYSSTNLHNVSPNGDGCHPKASFHESRSSEKAKPKNKSKRRKQKMASTINDLPEVPPTYTPMYDEDGELLYFMNSKLLMRPSSAIPDLIAPTASWDKNHETHIVPSKPNKVVHDDDGNMFVFPVNPDGTIAFNPECSYLGTLPQNDSDDETSTPFSFPETEDRPLPSSDPNYIVVRTPDGYINYVPRHTAPGREIVLPCGAKQTLPVFPSRFKSPNVLYHAFTTPDGFVHEVPYGRGRPDDIESSKISIQKIETANGETVEMPVETKKRSDGSITTSVTYTPNGKTKYKTIVDVCGDVYCVPISGTTTHHHLPTPHIYKTIIDCEGDEYHVPESQIKSSSYKTITDVDGNIYEIPAHCEPVDNLRRAEQYGNPATSEPTTPTTPTELTNPLHSYGDYHGPFYYLPQPYNYYDPVMSHSYHDRAFSVEQPNPSLLFNQHGIGMAPDGHIPREIPYYYHYPIPFLHRHRISYQL